MLQLMSGQGDNVGSQTCRCTARGSEGLRPCMPALKWCADLRSASKPDNMQKQRLHWGRRAMNAVMVGGR